MKRLPIFILIVLALSMTGAVRDIRDSQKRMQHSQDVLFRTELAVLDNGTADECLKFSDTGVTAPCADGHASTSLPLPFPARLDGFIVTYLTSGTNNNECTFQILVNNVAVGQELTVVDVLGDTDNSRHALYFTTPVQIVRTDSVAVQYGNGAGQSCEGLLDPNVYVYGIGRWQ